MKLLTPLQWGKLVSILALLPAVHFGFKATNQDPRRAWAALLGSILVTFLAWVALAAAALGIAFLLYRHEGFLKGAALQVGVGVACLVVALVRPRAIMYFGGPPSHNSWLQPAQLAALLGIVGAIMLIAGLLNLTPLPI
jgi:hypothetical protein